MLSFILAGIIVAGTLGVAAFVGFANSMSDAPGTPGVRVWPVFAIGFGIAALIVGSHYLHLSW